MILQILLVVVVIEAVCYLYGARRGEFPCILPKGLAVCG